jgi:hydrogenase/urease accessory protein HupE
MIRLQAYKSAVPAAGLLGCTFFFPSTAAAHLVTTGLGPVYDGIGHLLLTPEDLVPTLALAFYCGLRGAQISRYAIFILPLAWLLGGLFGTMIEVQPTFPVSALSFLMLGILVAADITLPLQVVAPLMAFTGLMHGFLNGLVLKNGPGALGLIGIMAALFVLVTLCSAIVVTLEKPWSRIMVRVLGSWIAACGMLMVGWYLKGAV